MFREKTCQLLPESTMYCF